MTAAEKIADILWPIFLPLSFLYCLLAKLRFILYKSGVFKSYRLPGFTISVGNLEIGGTGKTPIVIDLCKYLSAKNKTVCILTRGYKSGLKANEFAVLKNEKVLLSNSASDSFYADEAKLQSAKLNDVPVIIGANRYDAAINYLKHYDAPNYWILEDGFQHLKLKRNLDIVLLDDKKPLSQRNLCLPSGRLREGVGALQRASHVLFTRAVGTPNKKLKKKLDNWKLPYDCITFSMQKPINLKSRKVLDNSIDFSLIVGIAKPNHIIEQLKTWGLEAQQHFILSDHGNIPTEKLLKEIKSKRSLLITEKDYYRHQDFFDKYKQSIYIIELGTSFDAEMLSFD